MSQSPGGTDGLPVEPCSGAIVSYLHVTDGATDPSSLLLRLLPRLCDARAFLRLAGERGHHVSFHLPPFLSSFSLLEMRTDLTLAITETWFKCHDGAELAQASTRRAQGGPIAV